MKKLLSQSAGVEALWASLQKNNANHVGDLIFALTMSCPGTLRQKLNVLYQAYRRLEQKDGVSLEKVRRLLESLMPGMGETFAWVESQLFGDCD